MGSAISLSEEHVDATLSNSRYPYTTGRLVFRMHKQKICQINHSDKIMWLNHHMLFLLGMQKQLVPFVKFCSYHNNSAQQENCASNNESHNISTQAI